MFIVLCQAKVEDLRIMRRVLNEKPENNCEAKRLEVFRSFRGLATFLS